ncbi:uncharacterized protein TNCV_1964121 [Trichonephila clavipes]|nr:uncharacterized protein TNCV_1964121 [Trichonephila clavipes]
MCLPKPVSQKAYGRINAKIADVSEALAKASMKKAVAEENINGTVNYVVLSGDGTWKARGHTSLIGVCTLIEADCGKVLDMKVMFSYCKECDSYRGRRKFGLKYSAFLAKHQTFCGKNHSGSAGGMEVCGMQKFFFRSEQKHGLIYQRYIDGDSNTFSSIAEKNHMGIVFPLKK